MQKGESHKVGKIEGGIEAINNGKIIWDESFITLYPQLRSFDTRHHKGKLEFKPKEDELKVEKPKRQEGISLHAGATWALECLAAQSNIGKALSSVFSKYHADLKLLSVAFYMVLNSTNTIHGYGPFAETTKLPWGGVLNDSSISRLFQSIDETDVDAFFKKLNSLNAKELDSKDSERVFLALDSTSISTHSKELSLAQFGHNKDGDALRQLNVLFLVDQATGIPLFYRVYNGSTPDVSTVRRMIADSSILNGPLSKCVLVADRGYPSDDNISDCLRNNIHFLFRVPSTPAYFKSYVDESLEALVTPTTITTTSASSIPPWRLISDMTSLRYQAREVRRIPAPDCSCTSTMIHLSTRTPKSFCSPMSLTPVRYTTPKAVWTKVSSSSSISAVK